MEELPVMSVPCTQETTISHISKTLDRMERSQERLIELLETVSNQDARIEHLEEHTKKCAEHADILFERVRDLELNQATAPHFRETTNTTLISLNKTLEEFETSFEKLGKITEKLNRFFYCTTHKYALMSYGVVLAMIVFGFSMDVLYHWDKLKAVLKFVGFGE